MMRTAIPLDLVRAKATRPKLAVLFVAIAVVAAGCDGWSTPPTGVTTSEATLHAQTRCVAETTDNPCTFWFQYWAEGSSLMLRTEPVTANVNTNGYVDVFQTVTGLSPDMLYHAQFCGYGDRTVQRPGVCVGPTGTGEVSAPGSRPDPGDFSATQRFRTGTATTRATVELGRPLSTADTATNPISRDGGLAAAYSPTDSLWLFGDTLQRNGPSIAGTTAAVGPHRRGTIPTTLAELPTPPNPFTPGATSPAPFLPPPEGLLTPDNPPAPCGTDDSFAASWPAGLARVPDTNRVLIVYAQVCIAWERAWLTERLTLTEYEPATNRFLSSATPFVATPLQAGVPETQKLGSPVFGNDGYLYLFGWDRPASKVFIARVPADPGAWADPANYRWWGRPGGQPAQWTTDQSSAVSIVPVAEPWDVHVADYTGLGNHRYAMIVVTSFGPGDFQVYEASTPTGPWTAGPAGRVPDTCIGDYGCYAVSGHPELGTADQFIFTWYSPGDRSGHGHVRAGAIAW